MAFIKASGKTIGERLPFIAVLSLVSAIPKALIPLDELLNCAAQYKNTIQLIKARITSVITSCVDAGKFSKCLFFEEDSELFSIEDPIFRYFLNFLEMESLLDALGVSDENRPNLIKLVQEVRNKYGKVQASAPTAGLRDVVFLSYCHRDRRWLEELQSHLSPLLRNHEVALWADTRIEPGQQWRQEIQKAIKRAKVAVLLVSPDFLASDFIAQQELPPLLRAAEEEGLSVLWVPISACLYEATEIKKYQATSAPDRPLDSLRPSERNKQLVEIVRVIKKALGDADGETD
jgi:hypothetical protein